MNNHPLPAPDFLVTKEYRRFAEFCDACRRYRYIGICHGSPGVGKTVSAHHYARWDVLGPMITQSTKAFALPEEVMACRTIFSTAKVDNTPKQLTAEIQQLRHALSYLIEDTIAPAEGRDAEVFPGDKAELLILDEADRLKTQSLEQLRDLYDHGQFGLVLIGIPGFEKRLARYPQFYSRVGFVHPFRPLSQEEVQFILNHKWKQIGVNLQADDFTDVEAVTSILRITGGNFRLIQRLCTQIERIAQINDLRIITKEVVETAREGLLIGGTL
jgi:DNA transposition AAA+ family ATPase